MIPIRTTTRRRLLRGMMGGGAVTVALPFLDCFLNENGTALASGAPLPVCFGTWYAALGFNPSYWEPKTVGPNYTMAAELEVLNPLKDKINIYSGMKCNLDGHPPMVHAIGPAVCVGGGIPGPNESAFPSLDSLIADSIGTRTRFRSLEVSCNGTPSSLSRRSGSAINPSETSPMALYARIFGPEFKDPNAADFTPDPKVMVRRSVLSSVDEERRAFTNALGASDKVRADEYFTALRQLEQQLDLELQKPAPLQACTAPTKADDGTIGTIVDHALVNNKLFGGLLAHALACGQTRVINVMFAESLSSLRSAASPMTHHIYTHEEPVDPALGYQKNCGWFSRQIAAGYGDMVAALDAIKEGDGTVLDRCVIYFSTDCAFAKFHSVDNMPILTAGRAGGRMKTGIHVEAKGDPVTRVGLTVQQALGVPVNSWGTESNLTTKTISEVMA